MAGTRLWPNHQRTPSLRGRVVRYYEKGQWRVRAWPRPTGKPKSLKIQNQNQWFKDAVQLAKRVPASERIISMKIAKGTGLYPDDVLMAAMAGNLLEVIQPDGTILPKWVPKVSKHVFTGARLLRTSNLVLAAGVATPIPWQSAALDTSGFFDAAAPTKLTIPTDVNVVDLSLGIELLTGTSTRTLFSIHLLGYGPIAQSDAIPYTEAKRTLTTGPIAVAPGLQFEAYVYAAAARTVRAVQSTHWTLTVLDAL